MTIHLIWHTILVQEADILFRCEKCKLMVIPYDTNLKEVSKNLRSRPTDAERHLWKRLQLKHLGCVFHRQKPIGGYIVDFYCPKARLVIEIDGGHHTAA